MTTYVTKQLEGNSPSPEDPISPYACATDMANAMTRGEVTSEQLVSNSLARIEALDASLHAFVLPLPERAFAVAKARDLERKAGLVRSPLHGVPIAIKDLFDLEGFRTGAGSKAYPGHIAGRTAHSVRLLEAAGAVIVGKTHTVEFAFGGWGTNPVLGAPRNPFDGRSHRVAGGSSSGSAVAVASGIVPIALGTDTGGSIRIPAGLCGILGLKSSPGAIGRSGTRVLSRSHDSIGPMARSVTDLAMAYDAMLGRDSDDPSTAGENAAISLPELGLSVRGLRVAVLDDDAMASVDPQIQTAVSAFAEELAALGLTAEPLRLPMPLKELSAHAGRIMSAESYAELSEVVDDPANQVAPAIRDRILQGKQITAFEYIGLVDLKRWVIADFLRIFRPYDVLVAPTCPILAPRLEDVDEQMTPLSTFGRFVNMLDLCGLALPIGLSREGLPISIQIVGRRFADPLVLRLGAAIERQRGGLFVPPVLKPVEAARFRHAAC